jgi:hypothetical protein
MDAPLERLYMIRAGLNRVARDSRVLRQQVARAIEDIEAEAADDTNDSPGGHTNDDADEGRTGQG